MVFITLIKFKNFERKKKARNVLHNSLIELIKINLITTEIKIIKLIEKKIIYKYYIRYIIYRYIIYI